MLNEISESTLIFCFLLEIFQFFTKVKPPKGYYIFGDVGKLNINAHFSLLNLYFVT